MKAKIDNGTHQTRENKQTKTLWTAKEMSTKRKDNLLNG